jgi:CRISPR/Cas system-associated endonuclease Cas1
LLESRVETRLKIFKNTVYTLPESTRQLALAQPLQPVQQLLGWYAQARPEYWQALNDHIKNGIESRREQNDN